MSKTVVINQLGKLRTILIHFSLPHFIVQQHKHWYSKW